MCVCHMSCSQARAYLHAFFRLLTSCVNTRFAIVGKAVGLPAGVCVRCDQNGSVSLWTVGEPDLLAGRSYAGGDR